MTTPVKYSPSSHGFSLVEVVVACTVAAVLLAIAVPQLPAFQSEYRLVGMTHQLMADLQRTRMRAVAQNGFCRLRILSSGQYIIECSGDGAAYTAVEPPTVLAGGINFVGAATLQTFNRLGVSAGSVWMSLANDRGATKTVQINALGLITVS